MELQCTIAVNAAKEDIWPYYADPDKKIMEEHGKTYIQHSVRVEKEPFTGEDLEFLSGVFSDVPGSMLKIKGEVEG